MSKTILIFRNERLATGVTTKIPILNELVSYGYDVKAIVIPYQEPVKSRKSRPLEVIDFANGNNIPLVSLTNPKNAVEDLKKYKASLGILAAFGKIIPQEVIDIFPKGIVNIHPSLLPKHRGSTPIEGPILLGEKETGVSIMQLTKDMDAGPIFDQIKIPLSGNESKQELADKLGLLGARRLVELLPGILNRSITPKDQSSDKTSYDSRISPEMGLLDFTKPAKTLEREIRAYLGWPRSTTKINQRPIIITRSHAIDAVTTKPGKFKTIGGYLAVETSNGILVVDRLIPANSKEMNSKDYLRGHPLSD